MKNVLIETVAFSFTGPVITQLSALVDETEPGIEKALQKAVPLVLNGLAGRVGHGLTPETLLSLVREADAAAVLKQFPALPDANWQERGTNLLLDLLGDSYRSTVNQLAVEAGIRPRASGTLLQVAATAVLGVLGKFAVDNDFSATDFTYWLHAQKDIIGAAMLPAAGALAPADHYLARQPGTPAMLAPVPTAAWPEPEVVPAAPSVLRWQWGALLLVAVCLGYFFGHGLLGSISRPPAPAPAPASALQPPVGTATTVAPIAPDEALTAPEPAPELAPAAVAPQSAPSALTLRLAPKLTTAPATPTSPGPAERTAPARPAARSESGGRYDQDRDTYIYDTGRPIILTLADGTTQKVGANSTENRLYTFLASPTVQVDSVNRTKGWINFDRINFEAGKAMLTPESALQLGNIASILNTFPRSVVKIGGYTDSTGEALANYELSEARARAAMVTLASMGVSADRLQAKGYGPKYFVAPNNTPTGRALNRRVSVRVVRK